jgi:hypothetical protein
VPGRRFAIKLRDKRADALEKQRDQAQKEYDELFAKLDDLQQQLTKARETA